MSDLPEGIQEKDGAIYVTTDYRRRLTSDFMDWVFAYEDEHALVEPPAEIADKMTAEEFRFLLSTEYAIGRVIAQVTTDLALAISRASSSIDIEIKRGDAAW